MKKAFFGLFTAALFSALFVFILELSVRLFMPQVIPQGTSKQLYRDSVYATSSGLAPGAVGFSNGALVRVDQYGFRATSVPVDSTKKSWLLIGDSVTMGIGVQADSTFAGRLQQKQDSLDVLNAALIGYNVSDYLNVARALIADGRYGFDIRKVSLFWCLNDIYDNVPVVEVPGGKLRHWFSGSLAWLRSKSRLYQLVKGTLFNRPRAYFEFDSRFYNAESPEFLAALDKLDKISAMCEARDIRFEVLLLPYAWQFSDRQTLFYPQALMEEALRGMDIPVRRPLQMVKPEHSADLYLFGDGIHFSNRGHKLLAREL